MSSREIGPEGQIPVAPTLNQLFSGESISREWRILRVGLASLLYPDQLERRYILNEDFSIATGLSNAFPKALVEGPRPTLPDEIVDLAKKAALNWSRAYPVTATSIVLQQLLDYFRGERPSVYGHKIDTTTGKLPTLEAAFYLRDVIDLFLEGKAPGDLHELGVNTALLLSLFEFVIEKAKGRRYFDPVIITQTYNVACRLRPFLERTHFTEENRHIRDRLESAYLELGHISPQTEEPPDQYRSFLRRFLSGLR